MPFHVLGFVCYSDAFNELLCVAVLALARRRCGPPFGLNTTAYGLTPEQLELVLTAPQPVEVPRPRLVSPAFGWLGPELRTALPKATHTHLA